MSQTPFFVSNPHITPVAFTNSDSANTKKTIHTAGNNGSIITGINASSTDTVARVAQIWLTRSATSYLIASFNVPAASGTDGTTPAASLMNQSLLPFLPIDNDGQPYFFLESGDTLQVSFTAQVASGKEIDVISNAGNF